MFLLYLICTLVFAAPHYFVLENGMRLAVDSQNHIPQVYSRLSIHLPEDYFPGLPHLVEHLLFGVTLNGVSIDQRFTELGGHSSAYTTVDELVVEAKFGRAELEVYLNLAAARFQYFCAELSPEKLDKEVGIIAQEMWQVGARKHGLIAERLRVSVHRESMLRHPIYGELFDLELINVEDVCAFAQRVFVPGNMSLIVVGDVDTVHVQQKVEQSFLRRKTEHLNDTPTPNVLPSDHVNQPLIYQESEEEVIYLVWSTVPAGHPDEPLLDIWLEHWVHPQFGILAEVEGVKPWGWSEGSRDAGWLVLKLPVSLVELSDYTRQLNYLPSDISLIYRRQQLMLSKTLLTNAGRASLLHRCLIVKRVPDCEHWHRLRRREYDRDDLLRVWQRYLKEPPRMLVLAPEPPSGDWSPLP